MRPEQPPVARVERAKPVVVGRADEDQTAGRDDRPADVRPPRVLLAGRQLVRNPERRLPANSARRSVDRVQLSPRRLLARQPRCRLHEAAARRAAFVGEGAGRRHELGDLTEVARVEKQQAARRVERTAAPVVAALQTRKADRRLIEAHRVIETASHHALVRDPLAAPLRMLRREVGDFVGGKRRARKRRRRDRPRLRRRSRLAGHVAGRRWPFLDGVNRHAADTIQNEQQAVLGADGDRRHGLVADARVEQQRWRLQVVVPNVVVNRLKVPEVAAGARISRDDRRAEQVVADAIAAVAIERRRAERHVQNAALDVDRHEAPDVDAGAPLRAVAAPSIGEALAGPRHAAKRPDELAAARIPGADVAGGAARWKLLYRAARDHEILVDERRRRHAVETRVAALQDVGRRELHDAGVAETRCERTRLCVERDQASVARAEKQSRRSVPRRGLPRVVAAAGPVLEAALRRLAGTRNRRCPHLAAARGVERHDTGIRRRHVEAAADHQWRRLRRRKSIASSRGGRQSFRGTLLRRSGARGGCARRRAHVIRPCDLELRDVLGRNVRERRVALAAGIVPVRGPIESRLASDWAGRDKRREGQPTMTNHGVD